MSYKEEGKGGIGHTSQNMSAFEVITIVFVVSDYLFRTPLFELLHVPGHSKGSYNTALFQTKHSQT